MISLQALRRTATGCAIVAGVALASTLTLAQTSGTPERYTALAVNMSNVGPGGSGTIEIAVDRWSSEAEHQQLLSTLQAKGPEKLLDALQKMKRVGYIRTPNSLGYDLRYARKEALPDGGERVILATDRPIGFWEASHQPRSIDYPFTLIELHLNSDGEGEGKLSIATKITVNKKTNSVELEDYGTQPVMLTSVKVDKRSE